MSRYPDILKYANGGLQMLAIILLCVFAGIRLDRWLKPDYPWFTLSLSLFGVAAGMYHLIKDFIKENKE